MEINLDGVGKPDETSRAKETFHRRVPSQRHHMAAAAPGTAPGRRHEPGNAPLQQLHRRLGEMLDRRAGATPEAKDGPGERPIRRGVLRSLPRFCHDPIRKDRRSERGLWLDRREEPRSHPKRGSDPEGIPRRLFRARHSRSPWRRFFPSHGRTDLGTRLGAE